MLLHSGTFHPGSWCPNCISLATRLIDMIDVPSSHVQRRKWMIPDASRCQGAYPGEEGRVDLGRHQTKELRNMNDYAKWRQTNIDKLWTTTEEEMHGNSRKKMEKLKVCVSICVSKLIFGFLRCAWDVGGAVLLRYPVLRYSPVLCGHWKGGVWWALNRSRLKVLGIVSLLIYLFLRFGYVGDTCKFSFAWCFCIFLNVLGLIRVTCCGPPSQICLLHIH